MELRPYQQECLEVLRQKYREGARRVVVSLPTGTGKTVIFARFPEFFGMRKRLLVLAHREELLDQAAAKFAEAGVSVAIEQAERRAGNAQVVVASVQTLAREARLDTIDPDQFYFVVVDEAHHSVAPTYLRILERLECLVPGTPKFTVGFTATPRRGDHVSLSDVFEDIAYSRDIRSMIEEGWLCRVVGWRVLTTVDLDAVRTSHGDFVEGDLARAVSITSRHDLIVAAYLRHAKGRPCVAFCADVEHSQSLAAAFEAAGVRAAAVWGAMPRDDRRAALAGLSSGTIEVVTNCNVLTEGWDEPRVGCVLMARPTKSLLLYAQMLGRGTRTHPEKENLVVIDVVDNTSRHKLAGLNAIFDLPLKFDLGGGDAAEESKRVARLVATAPQIDIELLRCAADLDVAAERVDLFGRGQDGPVEIRGMTPFAWRSSGSGCYRLDGPGFEIRVEPNFLGRWEIGGPGGALGEHESLAAALAAADAHIRSIATSQVAGMLHRSARWREEMATPKQRALLRRLGVRAPPGLTRGQASSLITEAGTRCRPERRAF